MTSPKQIASNKQNALVSTGPKTVAGKRRSAKNALTHGLRSTAPIVPGESPAAWAKHRQGIVESLSPANSLESELVERAALLLWRLRRITTHECLTVGSAVAETLDDMQSKEAELARERKAVLERRERLAFWETALVKMDELSSLADDAMIPQDVAEGIVEFVLNGAMDWTDGPTDEKFDEELFDDEEDEDDEDNLPAKEDVAEAAGSPAGDWTVAQLRQGITFVAGKVRATVDELFAAARLELDCHIALERKQVVDSEAELPRKARQAGTRAAVRMGRSLLPENVELLTRYESHLSRQLNQTLQTLETLQSARKGRQPSSPE